MIKAIHTTDDLIEAIREHNKGALTYDEIAEITKLSKSMVNKTLNRRSDPSIENVIAIARAVGVCLMVTDMPWYYQNV